MLQALEFDLRWILMRRSPGSESNRRSSFMSMLFVGSVCYLMSGKMPSELLFEFHDI